MATTPIGTDVGSTETESPTLRERAHVARERIASKARETTAQVRAETENVFEDQKHRLADRIGHYGSAVHRAAHKLEEEQDAAFAHYAHRAAGQLDRAADYLRTGSLNDLRRDAERMVRRHQEVVFGSLFLVGFALARMLKASRVEGEDRGVEEASFSSDDYPGSPVRHSPEPTPTPPVP